LNGLLAIWIQDDQAAVEHLRIAFRDDSIRNVLEKSLAHCAPTILQELKTELETEWANLEPQDLDPWDWREIVKIEFSKGTLDRALKAAENAIKSNEGSASGWISRGEVHVAMGNYQQAVEDFTEGIKRQGESWVYKRRGEANFLAGDFEQSLADLTRAFELSTGDHSILTWISMERMRECQDTAFRAGMLRLADQVVDSYPNTVKARYNRGQLRSAFGHDVEALDDFAWVVEQRPNDADFRRGLIEFYVIRKRYPEAVSELDQAIDDFGDQFLFRYYLGLVTAAMDDRDAYRDACQGMLQASNRGALTSDSVTSHFVAWTAALAPGGLDDYGPVIKLAREAVESEPDNAQLLGGLGAILFRSRDFKNAKEQLERALGLPEHANTSTAYIRYFLAMTEDALGNHNQARRLLQLANKQADAELLDAPPWNRRLTLDLLRREVEARFAE
jgi:tetratricopeptide (TPR) repeat protein